MPDVGIQYRTEVQLARDLKLAKARTGEDGPSGRGHAVFLVGAGCSVSANIPAAAGVAQRCAVKLREMYDPDWSVNRRKGRKGSTRSRRRVRPRQAADAVDAVQWLISKGHIDDPRPDDRQRTTHWESADWGALYPVFFEDHLKAPNVQRELITEIVEASGNKLNWTYACLGELVAQRVVHTVLTTNFDQLVLNGIIRAGTSPVIADGPHSFNRILPQPPFPQVVHLHGSMHTYNLRNSRKAVIETQEDQGTLAMVHTLLQQCNVLVVVGYAGGEEGLMKILLEASERLESLVVYWVVYDRREQISPNCSRLMKGENKFVIDGGPSDKFFFQLMSALEIGPPRWVMEPVGDATTRLGSLRAVKDVPYIETLIEGHDRRIARAIRHLADSRDAEDAYHDAVAKYAAGRYAEVLKLLSGENEVSQSKALRLRATAALDVAQREPDEGHVRLQAAIDDFERLMADTDADTDLGTSDVVGYVNALQLMGDSVQTPEALIANLQTIENVVKTHVERRNISTVLDREGARFPAEDLAYLLSSQAEALIKLSEAKRTQEQNDDRGRADAESKRLEEDQFRWYWDAKKLYEQVINIARMFEVEGQTTSEAREGLAAVLQVLALHDASYTNDSDRRDSALSHATAAVDQRDKVVSNAWRSPSSAEDGGIQINLASALEVQWDLADWTGKRALKHRGMDAARRASVSFEHLGDTDRLSEARTLYRKFAAV